MLAQAQGQCAVSRADLRDMPPGLAPAPQLTLDPAVIPHHPVHHQQILPAAHGIRMIIGISFQKLLLEHTGAHATAYLMPLREGKERWLQKHHAEIFSRRATGTCRTVLKGIVSMAK